MTLTGYQKRQKFLKNLTAHGIILSNMILTAILTGICTGVVVLGGLILLYIVAKSLIKSAISDFIVQPDAKTPSKLATFVDQAAYVLASRLVLQAKTTLMGLESVDSKNASKSEAAEILGANPALGTLLQFIPGSRRLLKNPGVLAAAAGILGKMSSKTPAGNGHNTADYNLPQMQFKM